MTATTTFNAIPYPQLTDVKDIEPQFAAMSAQADSRYVARFANASQRDAANPTPVAGTLAYCNQEGLLFQYTGTSWKAYQFERVVIKTNVESTLSTTLQPDDQLFFFAEANSVYHVEIVAAYSGGAASNTAKFGWTFPSGATICRGTFGTGFATSVHTSALVGMVGIRSGDTRLVGGTGGAGTYASYSEHAILRTGSNAGNVNFTWAQSTSSATPLDLAVGLSYLCYTKIS